MHAAGEVLRVFVAQLLRRVPEAVVVSVQQEVGALRLPVGRPVEPPVALGPVQRAAGVGGGPARARGSRRVLIGCREGGASCELVPIRQRVVKAAVCDASGRT